MLEEKRHLLNIRKRSTKYVQQKERESWGLKLPREPPIQPPKKAEDSLDKLWELGRGGERSNMNGASPLSYLFFQMLLGLTSGLDPLLARGHR